MGFLSKLFGGNKEKPKCPICGSEMGFFSKTDLSDGAICDKCVARVTPLIGDRLLSELTVAAAKSKLEEEDKVNASLVAAFGNEFPNFFKVEYVIPISPKPTEFGIARAKALKDSLAAKGYVVSGEFAAGPVTVIRGGKQIPAELREAAPFEEGTDVESTLTAHLYKGAMKAGKYAWLILDGASGVTSGDLIGGR